MSKNVSNVLDMANVIFSETEKILDSWNGSGNLQFPHLMKELSEKMNWVEKQTREADALVRFFVRHNPDYVVVLGARGGIARASSIQERQVLKDEKAAAKKVIKAKIETATAVNIDVGNMFVPGQQEQPEVMESN